MDSIDHRIQFIIVKIENSKLDSNTPVLNDTIYDEETRDHLRKVENLSLWKYAKEDLVHSYYETDEYNKLPQTTIKNFINNSTSYEKNITYTINRAIMIMYFRTIKYAILLIVYGFEALRIRQLESYLNQIKENLDILNDAAIKLKDCKALYFDLEELRGLNLCSNAMCYLKSMVFNYVKTFFLSTKENNNYSHDLNEDDNTYTIFKKPILPQYLLDKVLNGFPTPHEENEFQNIPTELCDIEKKFQKIISLINLEYENVFTIDF
ncbi:uncharacterized protein LOC126906980 [Daktulosphaira vitifoliae]|uniref:uncharacterized protein LOC126906980 n=1 Tax=Daktulosphaira vitifoliae TaxID=58002 RepID=UPI0021AAA660|nr:uncharacterized protein LOC126906980 [Daktulosphaira vitifoliae]